MKATFISMATGFSGIAYLYHVDPPLDGNSHVVVSAVNAMFSGPETYIFGANEHGEVMDWLELDGSFQGELNIKKALENAGYEVVGG